MISFTSCRMKYQYPREPMLRSLKISHFRNGSGLNYSGDRRFPSFVARWLTRTTTWRIRWHCWVHGAQLKQHAHLAMLYRLQMYQVTRRVIARPSEAAKKTASQSSCAIENGLRKLNTELLLKIPWQTSECTRESTSKVTVLPTEGSDITTWPRAFWHDNECIQ
jgi:hypothetical protein